MESKSAIVEAIESAGSEAKLAAMIGTSQVAVHKAKRRGVTSPRMAVAIERVTGVCKERLCPDVFVTPPITQPESAA